NVLVQRLTSPGRQYAPRGREPCRSPGAVVRLAETVAAAATDRGLVRGVRRRADPVRVLRIADDRRPTLVRGGVHDRRACPIRILGIVQDRVTSRAVPGGTGDGAT